MQTSLSFGAVQVAPLRINGFVAELTPSQERMDAMDCWISKGMFSASLPAAMDTGILTDGDDRERLIDTPTLERIEEWALEHGY